MISNVEEKIDSHLDNLIKKTFFVEDNIPCVVIGGETVKYNKNFKLYFTSRKGSIDFPSRFQKWNYFAEIWPFKLINVCWLGSDELNIQQT